MSPTEIPGAPDPADLAGSAPSTRGVVGTESVTSSAGLRPDDDPDSGRVILVTGSGAREAAQAVAGRLPRAASVDGAAVAAMIPVDAVSELEARFLRYTAGIALADSFRLAGLDVVIAEDVPERHVEDYLDFAAPTPIHLVRIGGSAPTDGMTGSVDAPGRGIIVASGAPDVMAEAVLARLDESVVDTDAETDPENTVG